MADLEWAAQQNAEEFEPCGLEIEMTREEEIEVNRRFRIFQAQERLSAGLDA